MGGAAVKKEIAAAFWKERSLRKKPARGVFHFQSLHFQNLYESFENARVGAKSLLPKKAPPFFDKLRGDPGLLSGASSFMQLRVRRKPSQPVGRDCVVSVDFSAGLAL